MPTKYSLRCEEKNKVVVMSDLHLGEEECVLNTGVLPEGVSAYLEKGDLPDIPFPTHIPISYDKDSGNLNFYGIMSEEVRDELLKLPGDNKYKDAVQELFEKSRKTVFAAISLDFYKGTLKRCEELQRARHGNIEKLREKLIDQAKEGEKIDELVLLGDVLDFSLASRDTTYDNAKSFFKVLLGGGNSPPIVEITYIPGNHDHHEWFQIFEQYTYVDPASNCLRGLPPSSYERPRWFVDQDATSAFPANLKDTYLNSLLPDMETSVELKNPLVGKEFSSLQQKGEITLPKAKIWYEERNGKHLLVFKGYMKEEQREVLKKESKKLSSEVLQEELKDAIEGLSSKSRESQIKINVRYPHIVREVGDNRYYYLTHGHLLDNVFRPLKGIDNFAELEAFNCGWLEAIWYHLGQAGRLSSLVEHIYKNSADESVRKQLDEILRESLNRVNPSYYELQIPILRYLNPILRISQKKIWEFIKSRIRTGLISYLKGKQNHKDFQRKFLTSGQRGKDTEEMRNMVEDYLEKDVLQFFDFEEFLKPKPPLTFIFGHTHKTTGNQTIDGEKYSIKMANTGAWLEEAKEGGNTGFFVIENETSEELKKLPDGIPFPPDSLKDKIRYDADNKLLIFKGAMEEEEKKGLLKLSPEPSYQEAVERLFQKSQAPRWVHVPVA